MRQSWPWFSAPPQTSQRTPGKSLLAGDNNHSLAFVAAPNSEVTATQETSKTSNSVPALPAQDTGEGRQTAGDQKCLRANE